MEINIAICDDELECAQNLIEILIAQQEEYFKGCKVIYKQYVSSDELIKANKNHEVDIVFMDIELKGMEYSGKKVIFR